MDKRKRYKSDLTINDFYKFYKDKSSNPVSKELFRKIVLEFNETICKECIYHNFVFKMPARLGTLSITKRKSKAHLNKDGSLNTRFLAVDWGATLKLWSTDPSAKEKKQRIFHLNRHTKSYICRWFWDRYNDRLVNKSAYHLDIMRKYDRELTRALYNDDLNLDFYERRNISQQER